MYRHSLELILKAIAFKYVEDAEGFVKDTFHNLEEILNQLEPYIQIEIDSDRDAYNWMKDLLKDMSPIDKESDAFRYPFQIDIVKDEIWQSKQYVIKIF